MFNKFIGIVMLMFSSFALADRVDTLETWPIKEYCSQLTEFFNEGAESNVGGFARKISPVTPEVLELAEHNKPLPRESMWVFEWNQLNDRERAFMSAIVFEGWDAVESLKNKDVVVDNNVVSKMSQIYFEGCVAKRAEKQVKPQGPKTRIHYNLKTASNKNIAKPSQQTCTDLEWDIKVIGEAISDGIPQHELENFARKSISVLGEDRLIRILRQIDGAYTFDGTFDEWASKELQDCN
jgi:hypothetical protein